MPHGVVKRHLPDKGFGFLKSDDGLEYFFHFTACQNKQAFERLVEGTEVTFEVGHGPKGPRAEDVRAM